MIKTKDVLAYLNNFDDEKKRINSEVLSLSWGDWLNHPNTKAFIDLLTIRSLVYKEQLAGCDSASSEFVKEFSRIQGSEEAIRDLLDRIEELNPKEEVNEESN